jgi:hypothetical protein
MKALLVHVNGKRLCLAGVGDNGVIGSAVSWVGGPKTNESLSAERIYFDVGGIDSTASERVRWEVPPLGVGDSITITIVETDSVDAGTREPFKPRDSE